MLPRRITCTINQLANNLPFWYVCMSVFVGPGQALTFKKGNAAGQLCVDNLWYGLDVALEQRTFHPRYCVRNIFLLISVY
jgi:hypothetical protein